jgi:hypothetical protein
MKRGIAIFSIVLFSTILLSGFASAGFIDWLSRLFSPPGESCTDSDGGDFPLTFGTVNNTNSTGNFLKSDYCSSSRNQNEFVCSTVEGQVRVIQRICDNVFGPDYYCLNGECTNAGNTTNQTHSVCSGNSCIVVQGAGTNQCSTNADCVTNTTQNHSVCSGNSCIVVQGAGTNQCSTNADCVTNTTNQTHSVCSGNSCIVVQGAGTNQCSTNADCSTAGNETNATGTASFTSTPTGATVRYRVQGTTTWQFVSGLTPLNIELEPNNYEGKAYKQPLYADHTNPDLDFTITAGQTTNVHFTLNQTHHASCISNATCTPMLGPGPTTCEGSPLGSTCLTETCTDSDGGLNYFTQGTASNSINGSVTDFCGSDVVLFEAYCDENDLVQTQYKNCEDFGQYSCTDGACVEQVFHAECSGFFRCSEVPGPGPNTCTSNWNCVLPRRSSK